MSQLTLKVALDKSIIIKDVLPVTGDYFLKLIIFSLKC